MNARTRWEVRLVGTTLSARETPLRPLCKRYNWLLWSVSMTKFYYSVFTFTSRCLFVEYGDPSIPSHSWWIVPGTWEDECPL